jgi:D-glycero-alpha-D-manno-heptose-7-phosphate kinase
MADTPQLVMTCTPQRISFAGGGTDLAQYYESSYGAVLSTTIDKYVWVTVKRHSDVFEAQYRLNYYESENVTRLDDIKNEIARECLRLVPVSPPLYISTIGDLPASSGLGGSSSFAVGLLKALHAMRGDRVAAAQLAEEAAHIEIDVLKRPIGKQDHVAAAFGGFNYFRFEGDHSLTVAPHSGAVSDLACLFKHFVLFWTGISRDSASVLTEQKQNTARRMTELDAMRGQAEELSRMMRKRLDITAFGSILNEGWNLKRSLASTITTNQIDQWYEAGLSAGAIGGKLCGAGGGGFLLFVAPPERHDAIAHALSGLKRIPIGFEPSGARLILPHLD